MIKGWWVSWRLKKEWSPLSDFCWFQSLLWVPSVLWHCWLGDRCVKTPVSSYPHRFVLGQLRQPAVKEECQLHINWNVSDSLILLIEWFNYYFFVNVLFAWYSYLYFLFEHLKYFFVILMLFFLAFWYWPYILVNKTSVTAHAGCWIPSSKMPCLIICVCECSAEV